MEGGVGSIVNAKLGGVEGMVSGSWTEGGRTSHSFYVSIGVSCVRAERRREIKGTFAHESGSILGV